MSFLCRCGNRIATSQTPSLREGAFVTDRDFEDRLTQGLQGAFQLQAESHETRDERLHASVFDAYRDVARSVVFCDVCGRLHLQDAPGSANYSSYLPEREES